MQNRDEKIVTVSMPTGHTRTYLRFLLVERAPFLRLSHMKDGLTIHAQLMIHT
jgi:hypothetical protein